MGKELTERVLSTFPLSGVVGPYQQMPIQFICRTKKFDRVGGFADLSEKNQDASKPVSAASQGGRSNSSGKLDSHMADPKGLDKYQIKPEDYATLAIMKFGESGEGIKHVDLKVQMMARAVYPDIKINKQNFSFGECGCNDRRDMVLSIKNKSKDNSLDFNFTKVAHFKVTPAKGKLFPDSEHNITITFMPNSMGDFR